VAIAAPEDQAELDVEREIAVIQEALDEAQRHGRVQLDFLDDATLDGLRDQLSREDYHVLHYTGHGAFVAGAKPGDKGRGCLCFEQPDGKTHLVGRKSCARCC